MKLQLYELAIHISAPIELRIKRIEQRGYEQYGERVLIGEICTNRDKSLSISWLRVL